MRAFLLLVILSFVIKSSAQFTIPPYNIVRDSSTHISVFHSGNAEKIKIRDQRYSDTLWLVSPDISIKNGVVDHKTLTGEMIVREYYVDSLMIGYIEYDSGNMKRELYYHKDGNLFLEKRYDKGELVYTDSNIRRMTFR